VGSDGRGVLVYGGGNWRQEAAFAQAFGAATTAGTLASWRREHSWHLGSNAVRMRDPCSSAAHRNEQIAFHQVSFIFTYVHLFPPHQVKSFTSPKTVFNHMVSEVFTFFHLRTFTYHFT
jgi:hypothetical protein